jgi:hypothetical protein
MNFRGTLEQDLPDETLPHPESASDHPVEQRGEQPAPPAPAEESGPVDVGAFKPPYATDFDDIEDFGAIWSVGPSGSVRGTRR